VSISPADILSKISGNCIYVSKKIDGEFNLFYFNGENACLVNANGFVKDNLPVLKSAENSLKGKGVKSLKLAVELHIKEGDKRSRIYEVQSALASGIENLTISPFDILSIDNEDNPHRDYKTRIEKINQLFDNNELIKSVSLDTASSKEEVAELFNSIVTKDNAEGLVVRMAETPIIYKIKPLHTIDTAVIGFTEGEGEKIIEVLLAVQREDNSFVLMGRVGVGFSESQKMEMYNLLNKSVVKSSYVETDRRNIAFKMVKPEIVVEIAVNELLTENRKGIIKNKLIAYGHERATR